MKRVDSVISLIYSLSKSEKKHFSSQVVKDKEEKDYLVIYDIITKSKQPNGNTVKEEFYQRRPNGSFEVSIQYLYEKLVDTLLTLRKRKDIYYDLLNDLCKARMLYERSLFEECFEILSNTIEQAQFYENNEILTIALKLELEYLLRLNFPNMTEQELFHKHFIQNESLKKIRKITEQSSLHNLLKYRLSHIGAIRTSKQKQDMNDLMVNELYIAASSDAEGNFELTRNHKLFQANYLMGAGDYKAALNSYKELNLLFEQNQQFWSNPPIYYLSVLEGVLGSLRTVGNYDEMPYFLEKLKRLIAEDSSLEFKVNAICLLFQYELFPHLDKGEFFNCTKLIDCYQESLYNKEAWLGAKLRTCKEMEGFAMKEFWNVIQAVFAAVGGWLGYFLGGCDGLLYALLAFVVLDYITGIMCAVADKKLSSAVGFKGICRKVLIFALVGIGHLLDVQIFGETGVLRTAIIFFYLSNEGLSVVENAAYLGLPIPVKLRKVLEQLHDRSEKEEDSVEEKKDGEQ